MSNFTRARPIFDHHLTTPSSQPVQLIVCTLQHSFTTTTNSAGSCAHYTNSGAVSSYFSVRHSSPTPKARGSNPPGRTKKGRCIAVQRPFLFCHGSVLVNPSFDYVRGNIGHDRHEKTDKIAHGISFPCWFCTLGSTRAILSVFVFMGRLVLSFGQIPYPQSLLFSISQRIRRTTGSSRAVTDAVG